MGTPCKIRGKLRSKALRGKEFPQKKVLSLVLCVAVMLSVMVMGAGAAFSDQDKDSARDDTPFFPHLPP